MRSEDRALDGNALGGLLGEIFVPEMTAARCTCASCRAVGPVGGLTAYVDAPGAVVRCPACGAILLRIVEGGGRVWLEFRGVACLELPADA